MGQLGELALADFAAVGFDAEVDAGVLREVGGVGEGFGALGAAVWLGLAQVDLRVQLQVRFRAEHLFLLDAMSTVFGKGGGGRAVSLGPVVVRRHLSLHLVLLIVMYPYILQTTFEFG